uniref:F-box domain-containing protein n=1 Tax=Aegilops tauschii subsp. strangulata TaxID=200361 RepID=A0A453PAQ6_AEGTS
GANDLCFPLPHVPLTSSSPSSTPHRSSSSSSRARSPSELPVIPPMDVLPGELCFKIFHLLDHQSLAAAPQGSLARRLQSNSSVTSYMSTSYYELGVSKVLRYFFRFKKKESSVASYVAMASFLVLPRRSPLLLIMAFPVLL